MRTKTGFFLLLVSLVLFNGHGLGQSYDGLHELGQHKAKTYYSAGTETKARRMASQLDSVMAFYSKHLSFTPEVTLLVLSATDWPQFTKFPFYGMPHYTSNKTLVVAAENNDYWKSMVPAMEKIPQAQAKLIRETYTDKNGEINMEGFFDLLAIHEVGHAYSSQRGLLMQRRWMGELFPNILLHTYIAEKEPALLPALKVFPEMVVGTTDTATLAFTTLQELETNYGRMGPEFPQNYGWYQCRWHIAAGKIYEAGGIDALKKLWSAFRGQKEKLDDAGLAELLNKVHPAVAEVMLRWD